MGTSTLTAWKSTMVSVGWKCSNCGEYNCSRGLLNITFSTTTSSSSRKQVEEAKERLEETVDRGWKDRVVGIVKNPLYNASTLSNTLILDNKGKCKKCKRKELWAKKSKWYLPLIYILPPWIPLTIFMLFVSETPSEIFYVGLALAIEIVFGGGAYYYDKTMLKRLSNLPKENLPKILCSESNMRQYALEHNAIKPMNEAIYYIMKAGGIK